MTVRAINPDDEPEHAPVGTPSVLEVELTCPECETLVRVEARLQTRLVRDQDGTGTLALRTRAAKVQHLCGQGTLGLAEGPRER